MKSLVDLAYDFLSAEKKASFKEIFAHIKNSKGETSQLEVKEMVNLYTDMVLDNRFLLLQDDQWGLRENYKFDEIKKQLEFLFAINEEQDEPINEAEFDETLENIEFLDEVITDDELKDFDEEEDEEVDWNEIEKEIEENN